MSEWKEAKKQGSQQARTTRGVSMATVDVVEASGEGSMQGSKQASKQASKQGNKQACKKGSKEARKQGRIWRDGESKENGLRTDEITLVGIIMSSSRLVFQKGSSQISNFCQMACVPMPPKEPSPPELVTKVLCDKGMQLCKKDERWHRETVMGAPTATETATVSCGTATVTATATATVTGDYSAARSSAETGGALRAGWQDVLRKRQVALGEVRGFTVTAPGKMASVSPCTVVRFRLLSGQAFDGRTYGLPDEYETTECIDFMVLSLAFTTAMGRYLGIPDDCIHLVWGELQRNDNGKGYVEVTIQFRPLDDEFVGGYEDCFCKICGGECHDADTPEARMNNQTRANNCVRCEPCFMCARCRVITADGFPCCLGCLQQRDVEQLLPASNAAEELRRRILAGHLVWH